MKKWAMEITNINGKKTKYKALRLLLIAIG
jgi:hypothetical protein